MSDSPPGKAILLVNTGSPDSCKTSDVRRYLRQFLSDPAVMDIPALLRWVLLELFILPLRSSRSARLYRSIWRKDGHSPLVFHSRALAESLAQALQKTHPHVKVVLAMRYGNPSLKTVLKELETIGVGSILIFPLFPQYASATSGSVLSFVYRRISQWRNPPEVTSYRDFHFRREFRLALLESVRREMRLAIERESRPISFMLFSFHGLPVTHLKKSDLHASCLLSENCCHTLHEKNRWCYRALCYDLSRDLARGLGLKDGEWGVSFQSRMGPTQWIGPHTEDLLVSLGESGTTHLALVAPSFVADCLETLEELSIRGKEIFMQSGGGAFSYLPALNAGPEWVEGLARMVAEDWKLSTHP